MRCVWQTLFAIDLIHFKIIIFMLVLFLIFRDKTEELKQLTPTERQELKNQDARNGYGASSSYDRMSRRRERALKIYVDSSPKKRDE